MLNVWDYLVNGVWLKAEWNAATQALGKGMIGGGQIVWLRNAKCSFAGEAISGQLAGRP